MTLESVLSASVALLILLAVMGVVYLVLGARKAKSQRDFFENLHKELACGKRVQFAGGLVGTLERVGSETCDVRVKSGAVVEVSRYAIQEILGNQPSLRQTNGR